MARAPQSKSNSAQGTPSAGAATPRTPRTGGHPLTTKKGVVLVKGGSGKYTALLPHRRKTQLCKHHGTSRGCRYGDRCVFAHGEHELQQPGQTPPALPAAPASDTSSLPPSPSLPPTPPPTPLANVEPAAAGASSSVKKSSKKEKPAPNGEREQHQIAVPLPRGARARADGTPRTQYLHDQSTTPRAGDSFGTLDVTAPEFVPAECGAGFDDGMFDGAVPAEHQLGSQEWAGPVDWVEVPSSPVYSLGPSPGYARSAPRQQHVP